MNDDEVNEAVKDILTANIEEQAKEDAARVRREFDEPPIPDGMSEEPVSVYDNDYVQQVPGAEGLTYDSIVDEPTSSPITGGEGFGVVRRRHLLVLMPLPEYLLNAKHPEMGTDRSRERLMFEQDIREAMAKAARKLNDTAAKYTVTGYTWDLNDIVYDMPRPRTISATLVIERE